jgi:hypothetical protein
MEGGARGHWEDARRMREVVKLRFTIEAATARRAARTAVRWRNMAMSIEVWSVVVRF